MTVHIGTSGYSYGAWKGSFYPEDLPSSAMLRFYAERLPTVEINNTFYKMPSEKVLAGWAGEVPASFRFALKASQKITHILRLKPESSETLTYFARAAQSLGEKLGPLLFQLPPNFKKDVPRLAAFLALVPPAFRAAFEFRHESWFEEDVYETLRANGAALCLAEDEDLTTPIVPTADWGYVRFRLPDYDEESLSARAETLRRQPWTESYVFFKHEDEGKGPALAAQLAAFLG